MTLYNMADASQDKRKVTFKFIEKVHTEEPWFNEPLFNEVLDITNDILGPGQSYSKMYGIEPRYNEFFDITNSSI